MKYEIYKKKKKENENETKSFKHFYFCLIYNSIIIL